MATAVTYFFTPLVLLLIPEECHDEFFVDFNFFHGKRNLGLFIIRCLRDYIIIVESLFLILRFQPAFLIKKKYF